MKIESKIMAKMVKDPVGEVEVAPPLTDLSPAYIPKRHKLQKSNHLQDNRKKQYS